ncbi:MAG: anti-sigma factor antagonist [Candidatus Omnitrophota bacterium]|jgi:anti-anti-sigma factor|nr:MAG: anti-sigma factor antagonist [Candidatus Omnitrophota bacterium]
MDIRVQRRDPILHISLQGRFDAVGARDVDASFGQSLQSGDKYVIVDMLQVDYLSSAGLRVILSAFQRLHRAGGSLAIADLQPYCRSVLEMAGFTSAFPIFDSINEAVSFMEGLIRDQYHTDHWDELETATLECGSFRMIPQPDSQSAMEVLGHVDDVLYSRVTPAHLCSKHFFETEYSIGLGGLGDRLDDYFPIMGEMITIGGTMVWLPTDGNDTPDFLIPQKDTGQVTLRTGFNVSISGGFGELMVFESSSPAGATMDTLYQALFHLARTRRPDFRGVLGVAILAQMPSVFGSGIKRSPIKDYAPENGEMITHSSNIAEWFDFDATPRHQNVTALICGVGVDLTADLSGYDQKEFHSVFYLHPAQGREQQTLLHNHAVMFSALPFPERPVNLDHEIKTVVNQGDFIDMRHLLDRSTIAKGLIGISTIQTFRRDPKGYKGI